MDCHRMSVSFFLCVSVCCVFVFYELGLLFIEIYLISLFFIRDGSVTAVCCEQKFRIDFTHNSPVLAVEIFKSGEFLVTLTGL